MYHQTIQQFASGRDHTFQMSANERGDTLHSGSLKSRGFRADKTSDMSALLNIWSIGGDERGFTLQELLVTIVIMGILAAIGVASWLGLVEERRVESAANQVAADMRLAHSRATNQLTDWRVVFIDSSTAGGSPNTVTCGGVQADYCMVKLREVYEGTVGGVVPPPPTVVQTTPRDLPDGTLIMSTSTVPTDPTFVLASNPQTVAPSTTATRTVEANSDGTMRGLNTASGNIVVGSLDGDPSRKVIFANATARVRIQ